MLRGGTRHHVEQPAIASDVHERDAYSVQPGDGIKRNRPTLTDDDYPFEISVNPSEASKPASAADPVLDDEVAPLNGEYGVGLLLIAPSDWRSWSRDVLASVARPLDPYQPYDAFMVMACHLRALERRDGVDAWGALALHVGTEGLRPRRKGRPGGRGGSRRLARPDAPPNRTRTNSWPLMMICRTCRTR